VSKHQLNFPTCAFLNALDAVNTIESMMPTTVKVPPTIAHTWKQHSTGNKADYS